LATTRIRDDLFMTENYYQPRRNTPQFPQQNSYHNFCPVKVCNNFSRFWWQKKKYKKNQRIRRRRRSREKCVSILHSRLPLGRKTRNV